MAKEILLTNISSRKFTTKKGDFYPGTSLMFSESEAKVLLRYKDDIKRADATLSEQLSESKIALESKVEDLSAEIVKLKAENKKLKAENNKLKK